MSKAVFNLKKAQRNTLTIAHELCYNKVTIGKILCAKTQADLDRAMRYGRQTSGGIKNDCIGRI